MKLGQLMVMATCLITAGAAWAESTVYITPYLGYSLSNSVTDESGIKINTDNDAHYALGLETDLYNGRAGLFVSHQPHSVENFGDGSFTYTHFQSSLRFETFERLDTYFGASMGATIVDADWTDSDLFFSAGLQGGAEYHLTDNLFLVFEARWLANLIDSDSIANCTLPTGTESCNIKIDSKWLSQFQTNVGITFSF
ncbi:porin family protein [Photobacterium japonica]|uniref:outer membrane beta-barrel protein n=1 Tax=Photobacterium japonica TaxID=2910235 RepID=UPI003D13A237